MDQDRLKWITRPATLDAYEIKVDLAETPTGTVATVWAAGTCKRKRGYLWTHTETFVLGDGRYGVHDVVTHISMVAEQDRPRTNQELTRGLIGSAWEQPELPF
jgi:hypothetical protein